MNRPIRLGVIMDPIGSIKPHKDTSFAMLLEAQRRGYEISYFEPGDLAVTDGRPIGAARPLRVRDTPTDFHELGPAQTRPLADFDVLLLRKDPPFDMEYIYLTYLLELAEAAGVRVINSPGAVRSWNEKFAITRFPELCAPTRIDRRADRLREFLHTHGDIIIKPLDGMGGTSVFRVRQNDPNIAVILETLTDHGRRFTMAQRFVPEIRDGDKRILVIDGEPWPQALSRIPAPGETRGNLAAGGRGEGRELNSRDREICAAVGPALREAGLWFVGLDVIGDCLTEINVTSPTCVRELDALYGSNICARLFDAVESRTQAG